MDNEHMDTGAQALVMCHLHGVVIRHRQAQGLCRVMCCKFEARTG